MELPNAWPEAGLRDRLRGAGGTLASLVHDVVTPPADVLLGQLDTEEDKDSREGDRGRESGRNGVVVSRPKAEESPLEVNHRKHRDRQGGPLVGQIVRRPEDTSVNQGDGVNLSEPALFPPSLFGVEEDDGEDESNGETDESQGVLPVGPKHAVWTERTPKDRGGEESVDTGTSHSERCLRSA